MTKRRIFKCVIRYHMNQFVRNLSTGKGVVRAGSGNKKGKEIVRAGSGNKKGKGIGRTVTGKQQDF